MPRNRRARRAIGAVETLRRKSVAQGRPRRQISDDVELIDTPNQITPSLRVVGDFREKWAELVNSPPAWRHKPLIDAADVGLSRHKEARRCCTRCAAWQYWRGSEPSPPLLFFLGLCWEFAWGGAAGRLRIRRLLRALGVMFQRLIPRKSRRFTRRISSHVKTG